MSDTPTLEGFGIRVEPIREDHAALLDPVALDPSIWRYMSPRLQSSADLQAWVEHAVAEDCNTTTQVWITRLASGEVIGSSRLFEVDLQHHRGEIGYTWLAAPYRGTGVNPRVKLLQLTHAFDGLGLRRVALKTHHENLQSQRGILKLGAKFEGTFRNHMIMPDGSTRHSMWYSIVADEWPTVKEQLLQRIEAQPLPSSDGRQQRPSGH